MSLCHDQTLELADSSGSCFWSYLRWTIYLPGIIIVALVVSSPISQVSVTSSRSVTLPVNVRVELRHKVSPLITLVLLLPVKFTPATFRDGVANESLVVTVIRPDHAELDQSNDKPI